MALQKGWAEPPLVMAKGFSEPPRVFRKYLEGLGAKLPAPKKQDHAHEHGHSEKKEEHGHGHAHGGDCCGAGRDVQARHVPSHCTRRRGCCAGRHNEPS